MNLINGIDYNRQDIAWLTDVNYYRLRTVDIDSSSKISPVKILRFGDKEDLLVFPTLTSNLVFIQSTKVITPQLSSILGKVLQEKVMKISSSYQLSGLASGVYFIRIKGENQVFKIMKQ